MITGSNGARQALFKIVGEDGTHWLFIVFSKDRWEITCDGKRLAAGTSDRASIDAGIQKFLTLKTAAKRQLEPACA